MTTDRITIVVITMNRRDEVLASLSRHEAEVILVDNASTDGTAEAVRAALPHVRVVRMAHNAGAQARNVGVALATTPYVAFADDDSWWAAGALDRAVDVLDAHRRMALLAGRMLVGDVGRLDPVSAAMATAPLGTRPGGAGPDILGFVACGTVIRRSAFLGVGGFDGIVHFPGEEERVSLDLEDAGWLQCYVPDVVAHHHPSPSRGDPRRRERLIVRNALLTAVMRRPWREVARRAAAFFRAGDGAGAGVLAAVPRLPLAVAARRRVSPRTEHRLRALARAEHHVLGRDALVRETHPVPPAPAGIA
jgi:GT2 family glycosyltransferase